MVFHKLWVSQNFSRISRFSHPRCLSGSLWHGVSIFFFSKPFKAESWSQSHILHASGQQTNSLPVNNLLVNTLGKQT